MTHSPEQIRVLLCALGDHVRDLVVGARGIDMAAIEGRTSADTIYAIDRVADDALVGWFDAHWPDVELVSEGLEERVVIGADPQWTVIVDSIDGTRGLMYDKRPAWCLAAATPLTTNLESIRAIANAMAPTPRSVSQPILEPNPGKPPLCATKRPSRSPAKRIRPNHANCNRDTYRSSRRPAAPDARA